MAKLLGWIKVLLRMGRNPELRVVVRALGQKYPHLVIKAPSLDPVEYTFAVDKMVNKIAQQLKEDFSPDAIDRITGRATEIFNSSLMIDTHSAHVIFPVSPDFGQKPVYVEIDAVIKM